MSSSLPASILLRRLSRLASLSPDEAALVHGIASVMPHQHPPRTDLCAEGEDCPPRFVVSGWACRQRLLSDGRRQIVSFLLPGDLIGSTSSPHIASPCAVVALTHVETVDGTALSKPVHQPQPGRPGLARALHLMHRMDEVLLRDQIVRLGRQTAYERILHLLLEFRDRLLVVGLGEQDRYLLPLTQEVLADASGLSNVHVNRTLQQIRRDGLVEWKGGSIVLLKPALMEAVADWQPLPRVVS